MTENELISRWNKMSENHKSDVFKLLADAVLNSYKNGYQQGKAEAEAEHTIGEILDKSYEQIKE